MAKAEDRHDQFLLEMDEMVEHGLAGAALAGTWPLALAGCSANVGLLKT